MAKIENCQPHAVKNVKPINSYTQWRENDTTRMIVSYNFKQNLLYDPEIPLTK